jgi:IS30 family transposase
MRSYRHLSEDERDQIGIWRAAGRSVGAIARALGRAKATISRALSRCHAKSASGLGLTDFQAAVTASRHVVIAAARSTR